jgi:hypothetical protein
MPDLTYGDAACSQSTANTLCLLPPLRAQVALRRTIAHHHARRVAATRRQGMPKQHNRAWLLQGLPSSRPRLRKRNAADEASEQTRN